MPSEPPYPLPKKSARATYAYSAGGPPAAETLVIVGSAEGAAMTTAYARVGRVAALWAGFEQALDDALWTLAGVDHERGACLTSQMGSSYNRLIALEALLKLRGAEEVVLDKVNKLTGKWHALNEKRNRIVHDPVMWDSKNKMAATQTITSKKKEGLKYELRAINVDDYHKVGDQIWEFFNEFIGFREQMFASLPSS